MIEWHQFCDGVRDVKLDGEGLTVMLDRGRRHRLRIQPGEDVIELRGIVARRSVVTEIEDTILAAWQRNRSTRIVAFGLDDRGRLVGDAWICGAGLTKDEFLFYARSLAIACDLFEFQLTGRDRE